jgi:hypothetical protein
LGDDRFVGLWWQASDALADGTAHMHASLRGTGLWRGSLDWRRHRCRCWSLSDIVNRGCLPMATKEATHLHVWLRFLGCSSVPGFGYFGAGYQGIMSYSARGWEKGGDDV